MNSYANYRRWAKSTRFKTGLEFMQNDSRKYREDQVREQAFHRADAIILTMLGGGDVPTEAYFKMADKIAEMSLELYMEGALEGAALGIAQNV